MKKRSKAASKLAKARPGKGLKPKGRNVSKPRPSPFSTDELTALTRERDEALEQQTATSEVLQVISSSPGDLEPVFAAMLANAVRICDAKFGNIYRWDGEALNLVATHNTPPAYAEFRRRTPFRADQKNPVSHMITTKTAVQVADLAADQTYVEHDPGAEAAFQLGGLRTFLAVPMLKENELIGAFVVSRVEVRPFTDKQIELVTTFAAQAVIAIENARLLSELRESLQEQTATSEVLQVISSSPGDLKSVFQAMLENAVRICDAKFGNIYRWDGKLLHLLAAHKTPGALTEARKHLPFRPLGHIDRMVKTKKVSHISDVAADDDYTKESDPAAVAAVEFGGVRTALAVPMLKEDELIGSFSLYRQEVRPFTEKQIALVTNFAAQAVIAIENARLLNELRQRTDDLTESLEQQTATSEILGVISSSPTNVQPVLGAIVRTAVTLCESHDAVILLREGDHLRIAAHYGPMTIDFERALIGRDWVSGRVVMDRVPVHVHDLTAEGAEFSLGREIALRLNQRTVLGLPLSREGQAIGCLFLRRTEVRPFSEKQIALLQTFADQAVIAIENARLFAAEQQRTSELTELLEQQTATSEVLQVISSSLGDLEPVFAAMLEKAARICDAKYGTLYLRDGGTLRLVAAHDVPEFFAARRGVAFEPAPGGGLDAVMRTKRAAQVPDLAATTAYKERHAGMVEAVELAGIRTGMAVPMLKEDELIGIIAIHRREVLLFTDKQLALITNFAAQAVIAIENARLLSELRESLQEQTATSEVLQTISSSPGDLRPVFATMLEKAVGICDADFGNIYRWDGEAFSLLATHSTPLAFAEARRRSLLHPGPGTPLARMIASKAVIHLADALVDPSYAEQRDPAASAAVELGGVRTVLLVPMLRESELIGSFTVYRQRPRPFTDKQIALVQEFTFRQFVHR